MFPKRSPKMIDGSERRKHQLAFELQSSGVFEKGLLWDLKLPKVAQSRLKSP